MDIKTLLQSIPAMDNKHHLYLLIEGGAQAPEQFQAFQATQSSVMSSLFLHPQLISARKYGPWLLAIDNKEEFSETVESIPGIVGVIISSHSLGVLALQLSYACTVICPDKTTVLTRFYTQQVINTLAQCHEQEWHHFLFKDIVQWWTPADTGWQPIELQPSTIKYARERVLSLDEETWQQIADKPEVSTLLAQWQQKPTSQHFPPCVQRDMVIKALGKAQSAGLTVGADRKLYALCYLEGGKKWLESAEMQSSLERVIKGEISLSQLLLGKSTVLFS